MLLSASPVNFAYGLDQNLSMVGGVVATFDGLDFYNTSLLTSAKDVTMNNSELIVLTNNTNLSNYVTQTSYPFSGDFTFTTLITDYRGLYLCALNPVSLTGSTLYFSSVLQNATVFYVTFPSNSGPFSIYYSVLSSNGNYVNLYLTSNGFSALNSPTTALSSSTITGLVSSTYTFYGILSGNNVTLITVDPSQYGYFVGSTNSSNYLTYNAVVPVTNQSINIPPTCVLTMLRYTDNNVYGTIQMPGESSLVTYTPVNNSLSISNTSGNVPFDYLVTTPYKTLSAQNINVNINTLKNYYSPEHIQTAVLSAALRSYNKLYTGLNQDGGYDKIYLGYNAATAKISFTKDTNTYFHYPYGAPTLPLSASTLVAYGSYANVTPNRSDRIYKKIANYMTYSSWGQSSPMYVPQLSGASGTGLRNGTYFCSWLSAGNTGSSPVWMDRFYNPAITNVIGISASNIVALSGYLANSTNNYPNLIWDTPSNNTFEPGVLYHYHRIGDNDNNTIVASLSGLIYQVESWNSVIYNQVTGLSAGNIYSFTQSNSGSDSTVRNPYYIVGNSYGVLNTSVSDFSNNSGTTISFYAYEQNWSNIVGDQIVGNYFNGGIGIFSNNPIVTPYFTVLAALSSVLTFNTNLQLINSETYTTLIANAGSSLSSCNNIVKGLYDSSFYVVDCYPNNNFLSVFDPDDLITNKTPLTAFDPTITSEIVLDSYLYSDATSTPYVITKTRNNSKTCCYRKFLTNGILVSSVSATSFNNFIVDLSGNPVFFNSNYITKTTLSGTNGCVDSFNNSFTLSSGGLSSVIVRNGTTPIINIVNPEYINCDQNNNLWISHNQKYLAKISNTGAIIWSKQINTVDPILTPGNRVVNFLAELTSTGIVYSCLLIDAQSQMVYKIDTNGNIITKVSVPGLIAAGDSTGFDYQRKYVMPYISTPGIRARIVSTDTTLFTPTPTYTTLNFGTSGLAPGWHHFACTYDNTNVATLYVDGNVVAQQASYMSISGNNITNKVLNAVYNYKNNPQVVIGTSNFKNTTLNQWIELPQSYLFNGNIGDLRVYNITLNSSDITALSKNYVLNQFVDLLWLIPAGVRGYIEEVERFFLHRMPGNKSQFYDIRIKNSGIIDPNVQNIVQDNVENAVTNIAPAYTQVRNITWQ